MSSGLSLIVQASRYACTNKGASSEKGSCFLFVKKVKHMKSYLNLFTRNEFKLIQNRVWVY